MKNALLLVTACVVATAVTVVQKSRSADRRVDPPAPRAAVPGVVHADGPVLLWDAGYGEKSGSAFGEDVISYSELYTSGGKGLTGGVFVEVGAYDGLSWSNSLKLERYMGWRGVLIEGCPGSSSQIPMNRPKAIAVPKAVCHSGHTANFTARCSLVSGIAEVTNAELQAMRQPCLLRKGTLTLRSRVRPGGGRTPPRILPCRAPDVKQVPCDTMTGILLGSGVSCVDLMFVDVESYELKLLSSIDFDRIRVRAIVVEIDLSDDRPALADFLEARGYECVGFMGTSLHNQLWRQRGHSATGPPCSADARWQPVSLPEGFPLGERPGQMPRVDFAGFPIYWFPVGGGMELTAGMNWSLGRFFRPGFREYLARFVRQRR